MRRGCISLGNISCDICHRSILYPQRYLSMEESRGKNQNVCMNCCQEKGLLKTESDKADAETLFDLSGE